jgi:hypothetical protein
VAPLPIVEIVGASSHDGRIVVEIAKSGIALVAEERALLAVPVVVIDTQSSLAGLKTDDTNATLFSQLCGVLLKRHSILFLERGFALGLGTLSATICPEFRIRRISVSPLCVYGVSFFEPVRTVSNFYFLSKFRLLRVSLLLSLALATLPLFCFLGIHGQTTPAK